MKPIIGRTAGFLLGLTVVAACVSSDEEQTGLAELDRTISAFYEAVESGDNDARADLFSDGAMMMPDDGAIIRGKDDIGEVVRSGEGWVFRIGDLETAELYLSGDIAYTVNEYEYTWHQVGEAPTWHPTKNIHIWRRQPDGSWKLHVDIWNGSKR
jgi:ketosteroid isomerase-like protein